MTLDTVKDCVVAALEASIYVAPTDHGLLLPELVQLGKDLDHHEGEIQDAVNASHFHRIERDNGRFCLDGDGSTRLACFLSRMDPEPKNWRAFESVYVQRELARQVGQATAPAYLLKCCLGVATLDWNWKNLDEKCSRYGDFNLDLRLATNSSFRYSSSVGMEK